jgi:Ca2+-binding EF-hand superfamily protein
MIRAPNLALAAFAALAIVAAPPAFAASKAMKMLDTDKDGTIDLKEADAAAGALFTWLDRDKDGTLDAKELHGRVNLQELKAADPDNDGTLTKDEYLALVAKRFKAADNDGDGTIDEKELRSTPGRSLQLLLRR